jgi:hypothetical protein
MANSYESLLVLLGIILLSTLSSWIQRRRQTQNQTGGTAPAKAAPLSLPGKAETPAEAVPAHALRRPPRHPQTAPRPERGFNWEEELRRLLEGDLEPTPPHRPAPPSPLAPAPSPSREVVSPPPLPKADTKIEDTKGLRYLRGRCVNCGGNFEFPSAMAGAAIACPHCRGLTQLVPLSGASLPPTLSGVELASLRESAQAFQRASHLHEQVGARLQETEARTKCPLVAAPPPRRTVASREATDAVTMLQHSRSARSLMIASVVLGPPRAIEEQ